MKLLVATRNDGKFRELTAMLREMPVELISVRELRLPGDAREEALEGERSFVENALAKARHFHDRTGLPVLAEDSGLRVDALGGEPGVRTKRFAPLEERDRYGVDAANNRHLLRCLSGVPDEHRTACFHSVVAVVVEGRTRVFAGRVVGRILESPRGTGGFGYDPLFWIPELCLTMAELAVEEKNEISHRGQAVLAAREWLWEILEDETSRQKDRY